jgi:hypothetical protein
VGTVAFDTSKPFGPADCTSEGSPVLAMNAIVTIQPNRRREESIGLPS